MKNQRGSVLISTVIALLVIVVLAYAGFHLSTVSLRRAFAAENRSQAFYTALATVNLFAEAILVGRPFDGTNLSSELIDMIDGRINARDHAPFDITRHDIRFGHGMGTSSVEGRIETDTELQTLAGVVHLTATAAVRGQTYTITRTLFKIIASRINTVTSFGPNGSGRLEAATPNVYFYRISRTNRYDFQVNGQAEFGRPGRTHPIVIFLDDNIVLNFASPNFIFHTPEVYFVLGRGSVLSISGNWHNNSSIPIGNSVVYVLHQDPENRGTVSVGSTNGFIVDIDNERDIRDILNMETIETVFVNTNEEIAASGRFNIGTQRGHP